MTWMSERAGTENDVPAFRSAACSRCVWEWQEEQPEVTE